jgi:hypothetical protein
VSDTLSLRLDLVPLAAAIVLTSVSMTWAVLLIRDINRRPKNEDTLSSTLRLTLVIALALIGLTLMFQGLLG